MHTFRKIANVFLRIAELCCAAIVLGNLGYFLSQINKGNGPYSPRIVYTETLAAISTVASIILAPPLMYTFWAFPFDAAIFIMWMTSFGLLVNVTGGHTCTASWYYDYWGFYWGGFYRTPGVNHSLYFSAGCGEWRAVLAFAFIGGLAWLISSFLGIYVIVDNNGESHDALRDSEATGGTVKHDQSYPEVSSVPGA